MTAEKINFLAKKGYHQHIKSLGIMDSTFGLKFYLKNLFSKIDFNDKTILDIGAGAGIYSCYMAINKAKKVIGLEPEIEGSRNNYISNFVKLKDRLNVKNVSLKSSTFQSFDASKEKFDIILLHYSINHLDENACINLEKSHIAKNSYKIIFKKIYSISNNEARIIIADCSSKNFFDLLGLRSPFAPTIEWIKHQPPKKWAAILKKVGYTDIKIKWVAPSRLGRIGDFFLGNKICSFFFHSHFIIYATKHSINKVSFFIPSLNGGGAERMILNLANKFSNDNDFKIDLILAKKEGTYLPEVKKEVRIIDLKVSNVPQSIIPLARYLKRDRPDVLISTLSHVNVSSILAKILARSKTKIVVRAANTFSETLKNVGFIRRFIIFYSVSLFYRFADEIIAVSNGVADDLSEAIAISRDKIKVIYNPTDMERIESECRKTINHPWLKNKTIPVILAVGRLTVEKDYPTLIKAFYLVSKKNRCKLIILGKGGKQKELEELIKKLGLENEVDMPGFVKNPYIYMRYSDVFVLSSITEGLPNTLIETMACGTSAVSTDCPSGPREILDNGRYGKLVKMRDKDALAEAILETLKKPLDRDFLIRRVEKDFSLEKSFKEYSNVIKKYLNSI